MIVERIDDLIGHTPVIKLTTLSLSLKRNIFVKLEFLNPGGSVKDRIAKSMIEDALEKGFLKTGDTIVEPTSGNTGIGLAMVAASRGLKCILIMPETVSVERQKIVQGYGAKLHLTPGDDGINGAIQLAETIAKKHGYFMPMQFNNPANPWAHERHTAQEIIHDFSSLDAFVAGSGTGGTISGNGRVLKSHFPGIQIVAVEPAQSSVISGFPKGKHKIMGIGPGFVPNNLDRTILDQIIRVEDDEAFETARHVAKTVGLFGGISTGANIFAAIQVAKSLNENANVLTIGCSNAERYVSTDLFKPYT